MWHTHTLTFGGAPPSISHWQGLDDIIGWRLIYIYIYLPLSL